jgi:DNL zinc finger
VHFRRMNPWSLIRVGLLCRVLFPAVQGWMPRFQHSVLHRRSHMILSERRRNPSDEERDLRPSQDVIPQLPPIGSTSSADFSSSVADNRPYVAHHKMQLQYTCNICETRNTHTINRIAYRQGVVIARCKGCQSQHLIADHLGWTDHEGGFQGNATNTIEDYFREDQNVTVHRVTSEVFALEQVLQFDVGTSGSIMGDQGQRALE